jgi:hypothetical protein
MWRSASVSPAWCEAAAAAGTASGVRAADGRDATALLSAASFENAGIFRDFETAFERSCQFTVVVC